MLLMIKIETLVESYHILKLRAILVGATAVLSQFCLGS